jgi:hypothetical protein
MKLVRPLVICICDLGMWTPLGLGFALSRF